MAGVVASKVRKQRAAAAALTNKEEKDTGDEEITSQKQVRNMVLIESIYVIYCSILNK